MPETGSAFDGGHNPLAGFLRRLPPGSPFTAGASPLVWGGAGGAEKVVEDEEAVVLDDVETIDEEESLRWGSFRG